MELFSYDSIISAKQNGIDFIISKNVLKELLIQNREYLYNNKVAFDYHYGMKNYNNLLKLKKYNTELYIYGINTYAPGHAGLSLDPNNGGIVIHNEKYIWEYIGEPHVTLYIDGNEEPLKETDIVSENEQYIKALVQIKKTD